MASDDYILAAVQGLLNNATKVYSGYADAKYQDALTMKKIDREDELYKRRTKDEEAQRMRLAEYENKLAIERENSKPKAKTISEIYPEGALRPPEFTKDLNSLTPDLAKPIIESRVTRENKARESALKAEADAAKKEAAAKALAVPGFEPTGEVQVDETEAKNLRDAVGEYNSFMEGVKEYENLINQYGTTEILNRDVAGRFESLSKDLQLKVKNIAQLGVLSLSDVPFIVEQVPGPGVFRTKSGMLGALNQTGSNMKTKFTERMSAKGYRAKGGGAVQGDDGFIDIGGGVRVRRVN